MGIVPEFWGDEQERSVLGAVDATSPEWTRNVTVYVGKCLVQSGLGGWLMIDRQLNADGVKETHYFPSWDGAMLTALARETERSRFAQAKRSQEERNTVEGQAKRAARVAALQEQVADGVYFVPADDVALCMLRTLAADEEARDEDRGSIYEAVQNCLARARSECVRGNVMVARALLAAAERDYEQHRFELESCVGIHSLEHCLNDTRRRIFGEESAPCSR
jgi:anti-sigma28 factor (negative regulator of flagellin synthesis)